MRFANQGYRIELDAVKELVAEAFTQETGRGVAEVEEIREAGNSWDEPQIVGFRIIPTELVCSHHPNP